MALYLPTEFSTTVMGDDGRIFFTQVHEQKEVNIILTIHQFREIWNHEKHLIAEAEAYEEEDAT